MDKKMISVIIPFYNSEKYIADAISSVLDQTYQELEIICVDNGSKDGSRAVVESLAQKHPLISIITESRKGANFARNTGLAAAKGAYIQFLDADDVILTDKFGTQIKGFDTVTTDVVVSDRVIMDETLTVVKEELKFPGIAESPLNTVVSQIIITGNPLYRKDFLIQIGGWKEDLPNAQDWELNIRAVLSGAKITYIPGSFLLCRSVPDSLSSDWKKVSLTSATVIRSYYGQMSSFEEKLGRDAWRRIFFIFYLSAIHAERETRSELIVFIRDSIPGWEAFITNPLKRMIFRLFGLRFLIRCEQIGAF